ncbi:MAG: HisA/HisF-related TIM barrel protein [Gemmatimonadota bacterium]
MIVYAAIDLREGRAVQLVAGDPAAERVSRADAVLVAREWRDAGFRGLHVVDLDAALERGDHAAIIREILSAVDVPVQVGGGVRDEGRAAELIAAGAARVVIGTRAIEEPVWRHRLAELFPGRVIVAADSRDERVVTRGWTHETPLPALDFMRELSAEPLAGVLVTDVSREGRMTGVDAARFERLVAACAHPLIAAGGIRDVADLRRLADLGAAGAVLGMSLYTGRITPAAIQQEFAA